MKSHFRVFFFVGLNNDTKSSSSLLLLSSSSLNSKGAASGLEAVSAYAFALISAMIRAVLVSGSRTSGVGGNEGRSLGGGVSIWSVDGGFR